MRFLRHQHPFFLRLLVSLGILSLFIMAGQALHPILYKPLFLLLGCVVICSLYAGLPIALLIAILSTLAHGYFFQWPRYRFSVETSADLIELSVFLVMAIFMSSLGAAFRKALEVADLSKEEAESQKRSREEVLAMVSHDLKNPLAAIQMNAELIFKLASKVEPAAELEKRALSIRNSVTQMNRLIQNLLDFEKIRAGTFQVELKEQKVDQLMDEAFAAMLPLAEAKEIRLEVGGDFHGLFVPCDPTRILQVLSNLIGNAIKFTARGGSVRMSAEACADRVLFSVKDTGPGIPESQIPHLFERYWQAGETAHEGTGLGLSIVRGIVEAHGERIWADSKIGEGSEFYFTLRRLADIAPRLVNFQ